MKDPIKLPSKKEHVIQDVINAHERGHLIPSKHALEQMKARGISLLDIEEMIFKASREEDKDQLTDDGKFWKYAIRGPNENGDKDIRIIVLYIDPKMLIVTAIDKNK